MERPNSQYSKILAVNPLKLQPTKYKSQQQIKIPYWFWHDLFSFSISHGIRYYVDSFRPILLSHPPFLPCWSHKNVTANRKKCERSIREMCLSCSRMCWYSINFTKSSRHSHSHSMNQVETIDLWHSFNYSIDLFLACHSASLAFNLPRLNLYLFTKYFCLCILFISRPAVISLLRTFLGE